MGILSSCICVSTIVWFHSWGFNEMPEEKPRWEQHKDAIDCFEEFQKAAPRAPALPFTYHLANHLLKNSGHFWRSKDKPISNVLLCGYTSVG